MASLVADAVLLHATGLRIDGGKSLIAFAIWGAIALAVGYRYRMPVTRAQQFVRDTVEGVSLFALVSLLGAIASYPLAAGHHALVDPELERIDLTLHFDWISWYELVSGHVWLQSAERLAYLSIFATPAVLIACLARSARAAEIRLFIATYWLAAVATLAIFPLVPAAGPLATLWHGSVPYMPLSAFYQDQVIVALRDHRLHTVDLGALHGLICAPSFHAASALIYIATAFRIPRWRWPIIGLNLLMLLATPVEGTHYLADVLAGIVIASLALWLTPHLVRLAAAQRDVWPAGFAEGHPAAAE